MFQIDKDLTALDKGVWTEWGGSSFLIAHISNMKFQRSLSRLQHPHRRKIEQGTIDPAVNKKIVATAMSEAILLDWKDVIDANKANVPFSAAAAEKALVGDPEFRDFVSDFAMNMSNYRDEEVEALGNS